ncbi:MAG: DUF4908 domain-containing protein [Rhizomicrobium sp.]
MIRSSVGLFAATVFLMGLSGAQAGVGATAVEARLSSDRLGHIEPGRYLAGDRIGFVLDADGPDYLLRFDSSPEVFVLHTDSAALGGHVLQYDSGETAVHVSGWGGITLYTDSDPRGLPAMRTGDSARPAPAPVTVSDLQNAAQQDAQHWAYAQRLNLAVSADWNALAQDAAACTVAMEAMDNVARGLERFEASAPAHGKLLRRVRQISLEMAGRPAVALDGKKLIVTFDPNRGYKGRASSRAIAHALRAILSAPQKQS